MVLIQDDGEGNWVMEFDWALPEKVAIENSEILRLRDELVRMFGPGE